MTMEPTRRRRPLRLDRRLQPSPRPRHARTTRADKARSRLGHQPPKLAAYAHGCTSSRPPIVDLAATRRRCLGGGISRFRQSRVSRPSSELFRLQGELVELQEWVRAEGTRSWSSSKGGTGPARKHDQAGAVHGGHRGELVSDAVHYG